MDKKSRKILETKFEDQLNDELLDLLENNNEAAIEFLEQVRTEALIKSLKENDDFDAISKALITSPQKLENRVMKKIRRKQKPKVLQTKQRQKLIAFISSLAAILILGFVFVKMGSSTNFNQNGIQVAVGTVLESREKSIFLKTLSGDRVTIKPFSRLEIKEQGSVVKMFLHKGVINVDIRPRVLRPNFVINTTHSKIEVTGTSFNMGHEAGIDFLHVERGQVRQYIDNKSFDVTEGVKTLCVDGVLQDDNTLQAGARQGFEMARFLAAHSSYFNLDLSKDKKSFIKKTGRLKKLAAEFNPGDVLSYPWFEGINSPEFSLSTWVRVDKQADKKTAFNYQMIATQGNLGWEFVVSPQDKLTFMWVSDFTKNVPEPITWSHFYGPKFQTKQWTNLTVTIKLKEKNKEKHLVHINFYVNGALVQSGVSTLLIPQLKSKNLTFGGTPKLTVKQYPLHGAIDSFTMFKEILSPEQVKELYEIGQLNP